MTGTPNPPAINPVTGLPVNSLTTFNLDFPGGTPADLVQAIEKATGKPLNVIIPTEDGDAQLPPLKMNNVVVRQLFDALAAASRQTVALGFRNSPFVSYSQSEIGYGFTTYDNPATDSSIWYFYVERPATTSEATSPPICEFFQLQPYLNRGFTVDDITTAVQTGWKMAGVTSPPQLDYHKQTSLLIAFGKPDDLQTIQNVLDALPKTNVTRNEADYVEQQANKISDLENDVNNLTVRVSDLKRQVANLNMRFSNPNIPASPENSSGK